MLRMGFIFCSSGKEDDMPDPVEALIADFVEWIEAAPRPYPLAQETWRTSCPRLPVWEEAAERGFVVRAALSDGRSGLLATSEGRAFLARARRAPVAVHQGG
jgi:D-3-phosphoglycerate dehydrogenase